MSQSNGHGTVFWSSALGSTKWASFGIRSIVPSARNQRGDNTYHKYECSRTLHLSDVHMITYDVVPEVCPTAHSLDPHPYLPYQKVPPGIYTAIYSSESRQFESKMSSQVG